METLNLKGVSVNSVQFIPKSSINTAKKRRATPDEDATTACNSSDWCNIVFTFNYPAGCASLIKCRNKYKETVRHTLSVLRSKFQLMIPTVNGSVNVQFTFCSFNSIAPGKCINIISYYWDYLVHVFFFSEPNYSIKFITEH